MYTHFHHGNEGAKQLTLPDKHDGFAWTRRKRFRLLIRVNVRRWKRNEFLWSFL